MKTKIRSTFDSIEKKTIVEYLVGKLTTICTASIQCNLFSSVTKEIDDYLDNLVNSFDDEQSE